jgi:hypothetical protein
MRRPPAAFLVAPLAILVCTWVPGTRAHAQPPATFEEVVLPTREGPSYFWAYASMVGGAALAGTSFVLKDKADERYDLYLESTDPDEITRLYDETITLDRLSAASLITGEVLVALGLYLRFAKRGGSNAIQVGASRPATDSAPALGVELRPSRWALSLRF